MTEDTDLHVIDDDFPEGVDAEEATDQPPVQTALDTKINQHFAGVVVRKDLVKTVKGNAIVPSYVLEYLLGQYAASDDEATIQAGIGSVRQILADHYVHRNQSELVKSTIRERGRHKIIDKVTVTLNDKDDVYEAEDIDPTDPAVAEPMAQGEDDERRAGEDESGVRRGRQAQSPRVEDLVQRDAEQAHG